jgi:hypothetical protein
VRLFYGEQAGCGELGGYPVSDRLDDRVLSVLIIGSRWEKAMYANARGSNALFQIRDLFALGAAPKDGASFDLWIAVLTFSTLG